MLIKSYIRSNITLIAVILAFTFIGTALLILYRMPADAVRYSLILNTFLGTVVLVCDYMKFKRRHRRLVELEREISVSRDGLPTPAGLLEADYQAVISTLFDEKAVLTADAERKYGALIEYYTLWAHQIKTPIAALRLLLQSSGGEESREMSEELKKIEQYVEMVLGYLRLESDYSDYVIKNYDLDKIINQAVRKYASQFIRRKIALNYEHINCPVLTDEKWLLFALEQVLSNALKYTPSGSITIILEPHKTLLIKDTGIGIAPEDVPRVFDPGFTGYNGREDKKATGIGLYLTRLILLRLGHSIKISSKPEVGTEVRIGLESAKLEVE